MVQIQVSKKIDGVVRQSLTVHHVTSPVTCVWEFLTQYCSPAGFVQHWYPYSFNLQQRKGALTSRKASSCPYHIV